MTTTTLTKRVTIYLDPVIHKVLKMKSLETEQSISDIVNEALRHELAEDAEDLAVFKGRAHEATMSYEALLKKLKSDGKI